MVVGGIGADGGRTGSGAGLRVWGWGEGAVAPARRGGAATR